MYFVFQNLASGGVGGGGVGGGQIQVLGEQSYVSYLVKPTSQRHYVRNFINARHACAQVVITVVILSVCWSVCYQSTGCIRHLCNKMNVPANCAQNFKKFQLRDFAKNLSFTTYSLFFALA